jgi:hypothetical protein
MAFHFQLGQLSTLTDALPVLTGAWFYRNINKELSLLFFFFYFVTLQDYLSLFISTYHHPNVWLMNGYQLIEVLFYSFFLHRFLFHEKRRQLIALVLASLGLLWIYTTFFLYTVIEPNSVVRTIGSIVVILYSGASLVRISSDVSVFIFENPYFWLASGCLIYFSFSLIVYSLLPLIVGNEYPREIYDPVWQVHSFLNIFSNLLFAIAFLCSSRISRFQPNRLFSLLPSY